MSSRLLDAGLDDGEFVAADARHRVDLAHAMAKPRRHHLEQLIAHRMAERVVDALEAVEIEKQHRELVAAADAGQRLGEPLAKQQRLGRSVSASCRAICAIRCSARWRSVMSSWVATQPPSLIGWLSTAMMRPSGNSTSLAMVVPAASVVNISVRYWSMSPGRCPSPCGVRAVHAACSRASPPRGTGRTSVGSARCR